MVVNKSWADDDDTTLVRQEYEEDYTDEKTGIRTTVAFIINDAGKKVKVTRKTKLVPQKTEVNHAVAHRLTLPKFGQEKGKAAGPDRATTTVGEPLTLKLSPGMRAQKEEEKSTDDAEPSTKDLLRKSAGGGKVVCRLCKGEHFTAKCPYKDTLGGDNDMPPAEDGPGGSGGADDMPTPAQAAAAGAGPSGGGGIGGKYVPPSIRNKGPGDKMGGSRDDLPTLRITNISEDTQEQDLRDLFGAFGRVARVYVGRDRETGAGKGFAFLSYEDRATAQKAIDKLNGRGYDNLILSVGWSQPRPDGR